MIKWFCSVALVFLCSCGGRLTHEQRQQVKRFIASNKIKKITEAEVATAALAYGDSIVAHLHGKEVHTEKAAVENMFSKLYGVEMRILYSGMPGLTEVEQQMVTAYKTVNGHGALLHNVQDIGKDSILYTAPMATPVGNDTMQNSYVLAIYMPIRRIIQYMEPGKD